MVRVYERVNVYQGEPIMRERIKWYARQLLPLTYRSHYSDEAGRRHFCVWKMWLGRCFDVEDFIILEG